MPRPTDGSEYRRLFWEQRKAQIRDQAAARTLKTEGLGVLNGAVNQLEVVWRGFSSRRSFVHYPDFPVWLTGRKLMQIDADGNVLGTRYSAEAACQGEHMTASIRYQLVIEDGWLMVSSASRHTPFGRHE